MHTYLRAAVGLLTGAAVAIGLAVIPASPAAAVHRYQKKCWPGEVTSFCLVIGMDHSDGLGLHASATIRDEDGYHKVTANKLRIQVFTSSGWVNRSDSFVGDFDGWHDTKDRASTLHLGNKIRCNRGWAYRAVAKMRRKTEWNTGYQEWWTRGPSFRCGY